MLETVYLELNKQYIKKTDLIAGENPLSGSFFVRKKVKSSL